MRQKHGRRIPLPHLQRMHIVISFNVIELQKQLSRLPNPGNRIIGVSVPDQRKIGDGIQLIQIRAGHLKEVSNHQIRMPGIQKKGQAVEHIEGVQPRLCDNIPDLGSKRLKALSRIHLTDPYSFRIAQDEFMGRKPDVDHVSPIPLCLCDISFRHIPVILDGIHLPYHVVSHAEHINHLIKTFDSRTCPFMHSLHPPSASCFSESYL